MEAVAFSWTLSPPPLTHLTHSSSTKHFFCYSTNTPYAPQPSHFALRHTLSIKPCTHFCHSKLRSSIDGEPNEMDEAFFDGGDVVEDESEDDDAESSVDLLIQFLRSMFRKISKRAKKASRSVLPDIVSPQQVSFAVDGILLLAILSFVKALLEVVCNIGGTVFVVILLLRLVWAAVSYFQSTGGNFNSGGSSFGSVA